MIYKLSGIGRDVMVALDQNNVSEQLIADGDIDTLTLEEIIRSKVVEAVIRVESEAPVRCLEEGHAFGDAVYWEECESGYVLLPEDFMRLISFRMSDWERACYRVITVDDPLYIKQSSRYKGIRGNRQKPVCAIVNRPEGRALEFYSCGSEEAYVQHATYIPYPSIDEDDGIDISERCYMAVIYMVASLVLTVYGAVDKATNYTELAKSILEQ